MKWVRGSYQPATLFCALLALIRLIDEEGSPFSPIIFFSDLSKVLPDRHPRFTDRHRVCVLILYLLTLINALGFLLLQLQTSSAACLSLCILSHK